MKAPAPRFIQVAGRRVCWRAAGSGLRGGGPAAILLHGSPQSSRALAGLGQAVAEAGLTAIMPDTPGAGHSEPLAKANLSIADLAAALAEFVDALGLGRFALYGTHTGAAIAAAFAARYPGRVTALVLDGLAAWTDAERASYQSTYAPPFVPSWDGAHLTWLWSRMEAQSLFFPWHQQSAATWRNVDLSPPWHLHRNAMDMLDSGDAYRAIYHASLAFDPAEFLPQVGHAEMMMLTSDVLRRHADRATLAHLPLNLHESPAELARAVAGALAASPGDAAPLFAPPGMFWRGQLTGAGKPRVLLHPAGASSRVFESQLAETSGPVLAFDLPGHGFDESELPGSAHAVAALITSQLRTLGIEEYTVSGTGFGAVIAQAMGGDTAPAPAPDLAEKGVVSLEPEWDGSHLLRAWRIAWRQAIYDPWYSGNAALGNLDPQAIHAAAVDLLRAGPAWITANRIEAEAGK